MQSRAEHTGFSVGYGGVRGRVARGHDGARVGDLPMRRIPVMPAHWSMATARGVSALKRIALLLVEHEEQIVGTVDETALAGAADGTPVARAMKPLDLCLRPAMSVADARELFARAQTSILPVIAGGFVLGAVTRGDVEKTKA